jgi:single-strand DNA-binding protein
MNSITIIGRITKEPELKYTQNNKKFVSFCVAVPKSNGKNETSFIDCIVWEQSAEFLCRNVHKGNQIGITGSLETRQYTDNQGNNRKVSEIQVRNIDLIFGQNQNQTAEPAITQNAPVPPQASIASAVAQEDAFLSDLDAIETDSDIPLPFEL